MRKAKKFIALALVAALGLGSMLLPSKDVNAQERKADYEIGSVADMNNFIQQANAGSDFSGITVKLTADIAYNSVTVNNFTSIECFSGTFDGCGYKISGLNVTKATSKSIRDRNDIEYGAGMFGILSSSGTIKNLILEDCLFDVKLPTGDYEGGYLGAIVGINLGNVLNCQVRNTQVKGNDRSGGIVGLNGYDDGKGSVINCMMLGGLVQGATAGGVAGVNCYYIENSCNTSNVNATGRCAGGIVAHGGTVQNCYNTGMVSVEKVDEDSRCGGIAGYVYQAYNNHCIDTCSTIIAETGNPHSSNKFYSDAVMRSKDFLNLLNTHSATNSKWMNWEFRAESNYPMIQKPKNISKASAKVKTATLVYTGNPRKPAVTVRYGGKLLKQNIDYTLDYSNNERVGIAKVYISGINGYYDSRTLTFKIVPTKPKLRVYANKKGFFANWPGVVGASGYELQYCTSSKFNKGVKKVNLTSKYSVEKTVKKLKSGKRYYVRMRAYAKSGKTKIYSTWSKVNSVKVK
ncbi:MAG: fibronectin type III domain-containing protein [Wujia sp.]